MNLDSDRGTLGAARNMYRRIARNSAVLASGTAASSLFMMLSVAIAARALPAREFGVLALLQSAALMLNGLASFSTQQPVIKLGADAQSDGNKQRLGQVVSMGLLVDMFSSVLAVAIAILSIEFFRMSIGLPKQDVGSAWILTASLIFTGYPTSNGIFRLYDRFGLLSLVQTLSAACLLVAYGLLYAAGATLQSFVWVWATYLGTNSMLQLWLSLVLVRRDRVPIALRPRSFATADGRTLLHYCWTTWGTSTAGTLRTNGDTLMIGALVSVEAVGIYTVARQLAGVIRKFNVVYSSTVFPEIAKLASRADTKGARKLNRHMLMVGVAAMAAAVTVAAILGHFVIRLLFGAGFSAAYLPFLVLAGAAMAELVSMTPSMSVQIYRGPHLLLLVYTMSLAVFAVAAVALTSMIGITGMAIAQLLFSVALTLFSDLAMRKAYRAHTHVTPVPGPAK